MDYNSENYLPLWTSNFTELRKCKSLYVDKTDLVCRLAQRKGVIFFARPRRFGKSLLVSTLETLFRDGIKNFTGLKIEKKWNDTTYKVLKLDFSYAKDVDSIDDFLKSCWRMFRKGCKNGKIPFNSSIGETPGDMIDNVLNEIDDSCHLVLLIDEYDAPLTATLFDKKLFEKIRKYISSFYSVIKSNNNLFRLVFLTGIAKFNQASIFSSLNNLVDISLMEEYGTLLGYTDEEISSYFKDYIEQYANKRHITEAKILEEIKEQYDGFCFDKKASTHVYSTWSVLNFFQNIKDGLINYWYISSGRPTVLLEYLKNKGVFDINSYNIYSNYTLALEELTQSRDIDTLKDAVLLTQTGYLTIKKSTATTVTVGYPNKEVSSSMAQLAIECMMNGQTPTEVGVQDLKQLFLGNNPAAVIESLSNAFIHIPYWRYPVTSESMCRALVLMLLRGAQVFSLAENPNALGRSDLEVVEGENHWVFEFKFLANGKPEEEQSGQAGASQREYWSVAAQRAAYATEKDDGVSKTRRPVVQKEIALLADALEQIRQKKYGSGALPDRNLICVGMVFSQKDKRFVEWETYPLLKREENASREGWAQALSSELRKRGWEESMLSPIL